MMAFRSTLGWLVAGLCGCGGSPDPAAESSSGAATVEATGTGAPTTGASGHGGTTSGTTVDVSSDDASGGPPTSEGTETGDSGDTGDSDDTVDTGDTGDTGDASAGEAVLESPWGIASSHSSSQALDGWAPQIAATGIDWLRGFDTSAPAKRLDTADANGMQVSGILFYSKQQPASFPVDDLPGWQAHIESLLGETLGRVGFWEVWNEPPNFTADKTPESYATIVKTAYDTAKAVDPAVQIGLAGQSNNVNFLERAILAGAASHYDYVTLHPYEILGLVDDGWEAEYMSIVPTMRKMLAAQDPSRADAKIWFTELGEPVDDKHSPEHQAGTLLKAYTMAIAQGVTRVHWFEGKDGDSGPFGLIDGKGALRPSHTAMTTLIERLGKLPTYEGWVVPGGEHHGFVFTASDGPVMVAWARPGGATPLTFPAPVQVVEPTTGAVSETSEVALTTAPVIVVGVPPELVAEARMNRTRPFPWDGDYTDATSVGYSAADGATGLHPLGAGSIVMIDGGPARDVGGGPGLSFTVDPNFLSYTSVPIEVTAVLRRNGAKGAGFNLKYESLDGWKSTGKWYDVPGDDTWYVAKWTIVDDQFVGKWGFNFSFDSDSTMFSQYSVQSVTVAKL